MHSTPTFEKAEFFNSESETSFQKLSARFVLVPRRYISRLEIFSNCIQNLFSLFVSLNLGVYFEKKCLVARAYKQALVRTEQFILKSIFVKCQIRFYLRFVSKKGIWCHQIVPEPAMRSCSKKLVGKCNNKCS